MDAWLADPTQHAAGIASPLAGFSDYMAILARRNGIPITLLLGVGQAETQEATDPAADQTMIAGFNAWGYGKGSQPHGFLFKSWPDGINSCTEHIADLVHNGWNGSGPLDTVEKLGAVWVYGDATLQRIPVWWVAAVKFVMTKFGGNPEALVKTPLAPEV